MYTRLLSLGGFFGPVALCSATIVAASQEQSYSHLHQFISELGATGTLTAAILNYGGFLPAGLLIICLAIAFARQLPPKNLSYAVAALTAIFGIGIFLSGFASCDIGCPQTSGSFENSIHNIIGPVSFVSMIAGVATASALFRGQEEWHSFWIYSICTALIAMALLIGLINSLDSRYLTGMWQRLLLGFLFAWTAVIGLRVFRMTNPTTPLT